MRNLLLMLISTAVALIAGEVLSRNLVFVAYMFPLEPMPNDTWRGLLHRRSSIPGLAYELAPNQVKRSHGAVVRTNSYGMRDDEPLKGPNDSACNIVVLGDSITFGFNVAGSETYSNVLERNLALGNTDATIQVLNFGVGGYSSRDEVFVLDHKAMLWNPDLIIVRYSLNDPEIDPIQPLHQYFQKPEWWQQFNILRLIAVVKREWEIDALGYGDYLRYLHAENEEKWNSVLSAFSDVQKIGSENGIPILLAIFPATRDAEWSEYPFRDLHSQISNAGKDNGFVVVDIYDTFMMHKPEELMSRPRDAHPSSLGHRLAAVAIQEAIEDNHLLRCL